MRDTAISPTVDFDADGIQHGFLKLPYSHDASAWGSIMIPITVAKGGSGPTVLFSGGNHGDEYEGPVALYDLAATLDPAQINGRIIIVPAMNFPAFRAAKRTSPIDQGNMNRLFPGDPAGTVTQKIADYFQRYLLPLADVVVDIHSGGKTLDFVPFCASHVLADKALQSRTEAAVDAFNAPYSLTLLEIDAVGMYDTAAEELGKIFITTELGGGGTAHSETVAVAKKGVRNVLKHSGVLCGEPELTPSRRLDMPDGRSFVSAETSGLLEICQPLGARVTAGTLLAKIYDVERTGAAPALYHSPIDGILTGRHFPGLISIGDIVAVVAVEV